MCHDATAGLANSPLVVTKQRGNDHTIYNILIARVLCVTPKTLPIRIVNFLNIKIRVPENKIMRFSIETIVEKEPEAVASINVPHIKTEKKNNETTENKEISQHLSKLSQDPTS